MAEKRPSPTQVNKRFDQHGAAARSADKESAAEDRGESRKFEATERASRSQGRRMRGR